MTFVSRLRNVGKKAAAALTAVAVSGGLMVAGAGTAAAADRGTLRPGCHWDPVQYYVQMCDVPSASMGNVKVQIQPAARGGNAGLYLLDGMRATNDASAWTRNMPFGSFAPAKFVDNNITLVMPVGGAGSFYTNWSGAPKNGDPTLSYQWETFLTSELPAYLETHFGVARNNNSIAGLSMGGTAALNLAARHPDQFRQALSYSGYLYMTMPGMQALLGLAMLDVGGFNINNMYGTAINPNRFKNDPMLNMAGLAGKDVYISAASGLPAASDLANTRNVDVFSGMMLEMFSAMTTRSWEAKARSTGLNVTSNYPANGVHNWANWDNQLNVTHDRILNVMNAW